MRSGLTIALLGQHFGWGGGGEFLRHIANGLLAKQREHGTTIYLLLPVENKVETFTDYLRAAKRSFKGSINRKRPWLAREKPLFHESMLDFFANTQGGKVEIVYHDSSYGGLLRCLKKINADIVMPASATLGRDYPVPWVGYIYDFQHRYLTHNFTPEECYQRDINFASMLKDAKAVVVNSKAVKQDILHFYPWTNPESIVSLPFAPHAPHEWFDAIAEDVHNKYRLPSRYFLISNQFWIHKDHMTAIRAFELLGDDSGVHLVCTGGTKDYRRPGYLEEIVRYVEDQGLTGRIRILGHIPKRDQIEIMKGAIAVVQPTLFEGGPGGGCVYDAVSLGVPVLISDIPVNREVEADNAHYFQPENAEELSGLMKKLSSSNVTRPSSDVLIKRGEERLAKLGNSLLEAVHLTLDACGRGA